jgi:hypothetical protein
MVQLTEVEDEHFQERPGGLEEDEEDFTDTGNVPWSTTPLPKKVRLGN